MRLRGKGIPNPKGDDGDLLVNIQVAIPKELSDEERELFQKLSETSRFNPRT
jgi:curved DNA-binding protein